MKKGKSRHKRKKSRLLWIAIAVIGMAAITVAVCVAGMFKKEDVWKTPEELLVEYMNHIPAQEYEQMYAIDEIYTDAVNKVYFDEVFYIDLN